MATTLAVWYSAGSPPTTTTRAGRIHDALGVDPIHDALGVDPIHDALGVDPIHFESGYPKLV